MIIYPERDIPVLPTGKIVVFPGGTIALVVPPGRAAEAVGRAENSGGWMLALASREEADEKSNGTVDTLSRVGVLGKVTGGRSSKNGGSRAVFEAYVRFQASELVDVEGIWIAHGALLPDRADVDSDTLQSLRAALQQASKEILDNIPADTAVVAAEVEKITDPGELSYRAAQYLSLPVVEAQSLLEMTSLKARVLKVLELLVARREGLKVQNMIREAVADSLNKRQREAILREQLRAIQEELGEDSGEQVAGDELRRRVEAAAMPEEAKKVALRELRRLERMSDQSAETHVIRNYLELLCDMPWSIRDQSATVDLRRAEQVLERDHYGLTKIKRRILEHLAVMKLRSERRGTILLFLGPPGVGKTSLGKSIAEALGREFVRVSLGGVRDDADIRGHRRTYVGALPGRIIDGIRRAKTRDPVFILDEIDKLGRGWGGDPASALLEVLDPAQNGAFHDHYLDVPFDLSDVVFIATANSREGIPGPLLDRMEVVELSGYTADEKFHIAKNHLLSAECAEHGLDPAQVGLSDAELHLVIDGYTREAGVRSLRRELAKVCRAVAAEIARDGLPSVELTKSRLEEILGPVRFDRDIVEGAVPSGVVTGLAWTPVGGDILFVEAVHVPGTGRVVVTGQLGEVMKESSQIAVALARKRLEKSVEDVRYTTRDIHLHVPAGATPKDGPSAGVSLLVATASMMLDKGVPPTLAMTGEITLTGRVLPVGGIKEKVLAAARSGVNEVILPERNSKDLAELPDEVRRGLTFKFVRTVDELLEEVFGEAVRPSDPPSPCIPQARSVGCGEERIHRSA